MERLIGYVDASGNERTASDKVLTVNCLLATAEQWRTFDDDWQHYLKWHEFLPDPKSGRYVFHTTDFWAGRCPLSPQGLMFRQQQRIYEGLLDRIDRHTLFRSGVAVWLSDFRRLEDEFPFLRQFITKKPGTFLSLLCFRQCMLWCEENGHDPSPDYVFDQGDEFWGNFIPVIGGTSARRRAS